MSGPRRIVVTGAAGLLGWHAAARLHARNCGARFRGAPEPFEIVILDRAAFSDAGMLAAAVRDAHAVLHFAGVNRAPDDELAVANPAIARTLADACAAAGHVPHIVYANTIHAASDNTYGRSKRRAGEILEELGGPFTDLVLPHIFGECARPRYNNVTATLIEALLNGETPEINPDGRVRLLHAGVAAEAAIDAATCSRTGRIEPEARPMDVLELWEKLSGFHRSYLDDIFPDLTDPFDVALFNTYRAAIPLDQRRRRLKISADTRGRLVEAARGGGGGQTFVSWTEPGVTRGEHFHLGKIERFLVLDGEATIRVRRVLRDEVWSADVSGAEPVAIDMPTLHTHSIRNTGKRPLLTLFWANEIFDAAAPDTWADPVLGGSP